MKFQNFDFIAGSYILFVSVSPLFIFSINYYINLLHLFSLSNKMMLRHFCTLKKISKKKKVPINSKKKKKKNWKIIYKLNMLGKLMWHLTEYMNKGAIDAHKI